MSGPLLFCVRQKLKTLIVEYGVVALIVYLVISLTVLFGFWIGIRLGYEATTSTGFWGTLGAAYVLMRFTLPLRIAATIVITPFLARLYERVTGRRVKREPSTVTAK